MLNKLKERFETYAANVKKRAAESEIEMREVKEEQARYRYGSEQLNELIKRSKHGLASDPHYIDNHPNMKKQFKDAINIVNSCPNEQRKASKSDRDIKHLHPSIQRLF
jgi:hypothetical protein